MLGFWLIIGLLFTVIGVVLFYRCFSDWDPGVSGFIVSFIIIGFGIFFLIKAGRIADDPVYDRVYRKVETYSIDTTFIKTIKNSEEKLDTTYTIWHRFHNRSSTNYSNCKYFDIDTTVITRIKPDHTSIDTLYTLNLIK